MHPNHGAVKIRKRQERKLAGEDIEFLVLDNGEGLSVMVPEDQIEDCGVRPCMDQDEVDEIVGQLEDEPSTFKGAWSRRLKRNRERFNSGDPIEVAGVVRDLAVRDAKKGLSHAERRLYRDARRMLEGELAAVIDGGEDAAEELVDSALEDNIAKVTEAEAA